jgi:hypothetical protein
VAKVYHFAIKKGPKQHGEKNFWKVFKNICWISKKKVMKLSRFLEDLGRFFFFWNHHIKLVGSNGWSPICNRIPKFCTSLFVLYRFGIMGFVQICTDLLNTLAADRCFWWNMRNLNIKTTASHFCHISLPKCFKFVGVPFFHDCPAATNSCSKHE